MTVGTVVAHWTAVAAVDPDPPGANSSRLHPEQEQAVSTITSPDTNDVDEIRRRMALIRHELHEDVREVVATAEAATDWRYYVSRYPWVSLGTAFALGYFIVPRRRRSLAGIATKSDISKVADAVESARQSVIETATEKAETRKKGRGLLSMALGLAAPLAMRAARSYLVSFAENWIAQQQTMAQTQAGPPPVTPRPPGGANPGRPTGPRSGNGPGVA
jgi:ElaB/YqjD/DUF883 family membrane-anchored ribosome-binding protein